MQVCSMRRVFFTILASLLLKGAAAQITSSHFLQESLRKKPASTKEVYSFWHAPSVQQSKPVPIRPGTISPNFYSSTMAWTCRQELWLQKKLQAPLFLRLGSLEQVNKLEGK